MSTINVTPVESVEEVNAWLDRVLAFRAEKLAEIKNDHSFVEWATPRASVATEPRPGWAMDDLAERWLDAQFADEFPKYPVPAGWEQSVSQAGYNELFVDLTIAQRTVPGTPVMLTLGRGFNLSYDEHRAQSIRDALTEPARIWVCANDAELDAATARRLAAALLELAEEFEAVE